MTECGRSPGRRRPGRTGRQVLVRVLGYTIAVAGLIWVFHDIEPTALWESMSSLAWPWILPAIFLDLLGYLVQGLRWRLLLRPVGEISTVRATQAVFAGLFTNEILPMRAGELVRAYLVSHWLSAALITIVPSIAVERLFDAFWLGAGIGLTAIFVPLPEDMMKAADILGILVISAVVIFLLVALSRRRIEDAGYRPGERAPGNPRRLSVFLSQVGRGIGEIGISSLLFSSFLLSSFFLSLQILAFWVVMLAFGLPLSLWAGAAVFLIVQLGTAIPNTPSNVGTYQFFCVAGLTLLGVDKTPATGFSVVVFAVLTLPLWVMGLVSISGTGMSLRDIRAEIARLLRRTPSGELPPGT